MSEKKRVLLVSHDVIGKRMAGPGIRYFQMARVLAQHCSVTLAMRTDGETADAAPEALPGLDAQIVRYERNNWTSLKGAAQTADVIIFPSDTAHEFPQLAALNAALVVDGYDPLLAEWLALTVDSAENEIGAQQMRNWRARMVELQSQYLVGDFYICASERQRDWWLGLLEAHGRLNPRTLAADASLRSLVDVVPYGLPDHPLDVAKTEPLIKGVWAGIAPEDELVLWGGGLWPWLDPLTAIRAMAKVRAQRPKIKLVFPGTKHPNPAMAGMPTHNDAAKALADELNLTDKTVFFGDWVAYEDWPSVLAGCDVALTLHFDTLETRLAYRSRALEYIWAGLPTVATAGDAISELVATHGLGEVVNVEDASAVAGAIIKLAGQQRTGFAPRFAEVRERYTWSRVLRPLINFCQQPRRAADRSVRGGDGMADHALLSGSNAIHQRRYQQLLAERDLLSSTVINYESGLFMRSVRSVRQRLGQGVAPLESERSKSEAAVYGRGILAPLLNFIHSAPVPTEPPGVLPLRSEVSSEHHYYHDFYRYWMAQLRDRTTIHRKLWEFAYIAQALWERDVLHEGRRGLVFGVGREPLVSLFASYGCEILATDLDETRASEAGWTETHQHTTGTELLNDRGICDAEMFRRLVRFRTVDMNHVPDDLTGFDFCWSSCCLEHLGSLRHGMDFILRSIETLNVGGWAVHTTEFNLSDPVNTLETGPSVLYRATDIEQLVAELRGAGHYVEPVLYGDAKGPPPSAVDLPSASAEPHMYWREGAFVSTSIGLIVQRRR